jgi:hypothetical protein
MFRYIATLAFAFSAVALGASADISKVNGSIVVEAGQQAGDVSTVNGSITVGRGSQVQDVETVNGSVRLEELSTAASAETVNGDVYVAAGSRIEGGIHVEKNQGWNWGRQPKNPRVTIESGAVVNGTLQFERPVDLYVGAGVTLPPVEGVQPQQFKLH